MDLKQRQRKKKENLLIRQNRNKRLITLLGKGARPQEIADDLDISIAMYYKLLKQLRAKIESKDKSDEALMKIIVSREQIYRDAQQELLKAKKFGNSLDNLRPKERLMIESKVTNQTLNALKVLNQTVDGMEKTYARVGLVPIEKQSVEISGTDKVIGYLKSWQKPLKDKSK